MKDGYCHSSHFIEKRMETPVCPGRLGPRFELGYVVVYTVLITHLYSASCYLYL